jgi:hypothetical protein
MIFSYAAIAYNITNLQKLRHPPPAKSLLQSQSGDKLTWRGWMESVENDPFRHFAPAIRCVAHP